MTLHKVRVIGTQEVNGTKPGRTTTLDDEVVNIDALLGEHVKLIKPRKPEGDS